MARGYWLPPNSENLLACNGFFVKSNAISETDAEKRWELFLEQISKGLQDKENSLKIKKEWCQLNDGQNRFVVLCDELVDIVAEETKDYFAIYVLIPERCTEQYLAKRDFWRYMLSLKKTLIALYPCSVKQRKNYRQLIDIG